MSSASGVSSYPFLFAPTVLTTSAATLYTVPATPVTTILKNAVLYFSNTTGAAQTITVYYVPSGGTAGVGNAITVTLTINPAAAPTALPVSDLLAGSTIQALASANTSITVFAKGGALFV
jgi:hypothetical protein